MKAEDGVIMDILLRYVADNREALREIARAPVRAAAAPEPAAATAEPLDVKMDVLQAVSNTIADDYLFFAARSAARDASARVADATFNSTWMAGDHVRSSLFDIVLTAARGEVARRIRDDAAFAEIMDETPLLMAASGAACPPPPPPASGAADPDPIDLCCIYSSACT
jgi:hypothetical protein